jgi:hypothetical protein
MVFIGAGMYASDSFRIYSDLLPGRGGPEGERKWVDKWERAVRRWRSSPRFSLDGEPSCGQGVEDVCGEDDLVDRTREVGGIEEVGEYLSDDQADDGQEEWRTVRPKGTCRCPPVRDRELTAIKQTKSFGGIWWV